MKWPPMSIREEKETIEYALDRVIQHSLLDKRTNVGQTIQVRMRN